MTRGHWKIGHTNDYYPFCFQNSESPSLQGFHIEVVTLVASQLGISTTFSQFTWSHLERDMDAGSFDVFAAGLTLTPQRVNKFYFVAPFIEVHSLLVCLDTSLPNAVTQVGVNNGGYLNSVARAQFPEEVIKLCEHNQNLPALLIDHEVSHILTDSLEFKFWQKHHPVRMLIARQINEQRIGLMVKDQTIATLWQKAVDDQSMRKSLQKVAAKYDIDIDFDAV